MGNVKGPYDKADWLTMLMLKQSVSNYRQIDANHFKEVIQMEKDILKDYMRKEAA